MDVSTYCTSRTQLFSFPQASQLLVLPKLPPTAVQFLNWIMLYIPTNYPLISHHFYRQHQITAVLSIGAALIRVGCVPEVIVKAGIAMPDSSFPQIFLREFIR